jgi:hypothetical protein
VAASFLCIKLFGFCLPYIGKLPGLAAASAVPLLVEQHSQKNILQSFAGYHAGKTLLF